MGQPQQAHGLVAIKVDVWCSWVNIIIVFADFATNHNDLPVLKGIREEKMLSFRSAKSLYWNERVPCFRLGIPCSYYLFIFVFVIDDWCAIFYLCDSSRIIFIIVISTILFLFFFTGRLPYVICFSFWIFDVLMSGVRLYHCDQSATSLLWKQILLKSDLIGLWRNLNIRLP